MTRRSLFALFAALPIPMISGFWRNNSAVFVRSSGELASKFPEVDGTEPAWLADWLHLPRIAMCQQDIARVQDPRERALAAHILPRIQAGTGYTFQYSGGSNPGTVRAVLPILLFANTHGNETCEERGPFYLLAYCLTRNAPRTFRLDRIHALSRDSRDAATLQWTEA